MSSGENQKKSVATIDSETFEVEIFNSLSECAKKLNTSVKAVSKVANDKNYYSHKGKTVVFYIDDEQLKNDIIIFKEKIYNRINGKYEIPETRICSVCKQEYPLTNEFFHKGRKNTIYIKDTFRRECKTCRVIEGRKRYNKDKDERLINYEKQVIHVFRRYKKLDKNKYFFNLTLDWIRENLSKPCVYCGFDSCGFDRKDNSLGHTNNNCVPCCIECNNGRMNNFTHEEFFIIGEAIRQIKINRKNNE
jgi:hypothetical protein